MLDSKDYKGPLRFNLPWAPTVNISHHSHTGLLVFGISFFEVSELLGLEEHYWDIGTSKRSWSFDALDALERSVDEHYSEAEHQVPNSALGGSLPGVPRPHPLWAWPYAHPSHNVAPAQPASREPERAEGSVEESGLL